MKEDLKCYCYAKLHGDIDKCMITMNDCKPCIECILLINEQNNILTDKLITIKKYIDKKIKYQSARIKNEVFEEHYRRKTIIVNLKQVKSFVNKIITGEQQSCKMI